MLLCLNGWKYGAKILPDWYILIQKLKLLNCFRSWQGLALANSGLFKGVQLSQVSRSAYLAEIAEILHVLTCNNFSY